MSSAPDRKDFWVPTAWFAPLSPDPAPGTSVRPTVSARSIMLTKLCAGRSGSPIGSGRALRLSLR